jgi:hypothetical protein
MEDRPLSEILAYFMSQATRQSIFQPTTHFLDQVLEALLHLGPRFSTVKKLPALQRLFAVNGGKTLPAAGQAIPGASGQPIHLLITAFDYDRNIAAFFRSAPAGGPAWGVGAASDDTTVAQAIHASSDPPVQYFDEPATWGDKSNDFWDGAIAGYNNPVVAGVAEAITLDIATADIRALAIGTGTIKWPGPPSPDPKPLMAKKPSSNFVSDLAKLAGSILDDPPDVASFHAHVMTGGPQGLPPGAISRIVRMSPMVSPVPDGAGGWIPPANWSVEQLTHLAGIDLTALNQIDVEYIADYADYWLAGGPDSPLNQPIRMDADTLTSKLGPMSFQGALDQWNLITA